MPIEKSAGAVVFLKSKDKIEYLLLRHEWGHWDLPKGKIEKGESLEDTAKREIKEEAGLQEVKIIPGFKEHIKYFYKPKHLPRTESKVLVRGLPPAKKKETIFKIVTFLLAKADTKKVKISYEHKGYKWLSYEEALDKLTFGNAKNVLKKADDFLSKKSLQNSQKYS